MDFALLILLIVALAVLSAWTAGGFVAWARAEWGRIKADTWAPPVATSQDPRVADLTARQLHLTARMKREGRHLLANKPYKPVLTKAADTHPADLDNVVPLRRKRP